MARYVLFFSIEQTYKNFRNFAIFAGKLNDMIRDITSSVRYIGVDDLDIDLFESQYTVPEGMAYNSYLIDGGKLAVMDTVDARCADAWKAHLGEALAGRKPDYLVVHHLEPDHSGLVGWMLEEFPDLQVVLSAKAAQMLGQFLPAAPAVERILTVKEGDVLQLGSRSLRFTAAPMVHWPEVLVSFCPEEGILFSADAFGKFGALSKCGFWGEEDADWACEGRRYYFNIVGKYGPQVQMLLKKLSAADIRMIAPLHGPVLREGLENYLSLYNIWSSYGVETEGVFVACASIHGGTLAAAETLVGILKAKGCPKVAFSDLTRDDAAEAVEDAFRYGKMVLLAASYDAGLFTPAYNFLHTLQMKGYQKRRVALVENGSWAPSAGRVMKEMLSAMKEVEVVEPVVTIRSRLKPSDIPALEALADAIL